MRMKSIIYEIIFATKETLQIKIALVKLRNDNLNDLERFNKLDFSVCILF